MTNHKTNTPFRTREEIEASIEDGEEEQIADEDEKALLEYHTRQTERRREAEKKVRARLERER